MDRRAACTVLVTSLLLFTLLSLRSPPHASAGDPPPPPTRVYVKPSNITDAYNVGGAFTVEICIENVTDLYTWAIGLEWNPAVLECSTTNPLGPFREGPFLKTGGSTIGITNPQWINNTVGRISPPYGYTLLAAEAGVNGSGTLAYVDFRVKGYGETWINFTAETELLDSTPLQPRKIPADLQPGWFKLRPPWPTARFTYSPPSPIVGESVTFNAGPSDPALISMNPNVYRYITNYAWDFDDGNVTSVSVPVITHVYAAAETYTVNLTVTAPEATPETNSTSRDVKVYPPPPHSPTAKFDYSPFPYLLVNESVAFNASASEPGFNGTHSVPIANYTWDFGDGNITTVADPVICHVYALNRTYAVNLTVTCRDDPVLISGRLTSSSTRQNVTVALFAGGITVRVRWSDGTPVQGAGVKINETMYWTDEDGLAYSPPLENGTYSLGVRYMGVTLLNTTFFVNMPVTVTCTVYLPPVAYFTYSPPSPRVNRTVTFDASASHDPDKGEIENYAWSFGDGTGGTGVTVGHNYTKAGTYTVNLTVRDDEGDSATFSFNVTVSPLEPPVAHFTYSPAAPYVGESVAFDASASYDPDGTIVGYKWNFGDGATGAGVTATHAYAAAGTYPVKLAVTDDDGLNGTFSANLTVSALPVYSLAVKAVWSNGSAIKGVEAAASNETGPVSAGTTDASGLVIFPLTGERAYNVTVSYMGVTLLNTAVYLGANTTLRCTVNSGPYDMVRILEAQIAVLQGNVTDLLKTVGEKVAQIAELQGNVTDLLNTVAGLLNNVTERDILIDMLRGNLTDLLNLVAELQDNNTELMNNVTRAQQQYESLNRTLADREAQIAQLEEDVTQATREIDALKGQVATNLYVGLGGGLAAGVAVGLAVIYVLRGVRPSRRRPSP